MLENTLTTFGDEGNDALGGAAAPYLFLALDYDRPTAPSARCCLAAVDMVLIGRSTRRQLTLAEVDGLRTLSIGLPDPRMSSRHARLERAMGQWFIVDADSKNGLLRNGVRTKRAALADGDLLELGHTLFLYRAAMPASKQAVTEVRRNAVSGLATLLPSLEQHFNQLRDIAQTEVPVLVRGETGTGKELAARAVHILSERPGRLVAANCAALPEGVFESQMFGHRKGAFSGAVENRAGVFRSAHRGTLFLDEVGDLPKRPQAALLRALQEGEVIPVGEVDPVRVDVRVVSATNQTLEDRVDEGEFRSDLLARLNGFVMVLPPLRERREDLGLLVGLLLEKLSAAGEDVQLTREAANALFSYDWPLNIRELEKCLASSLALARGKPIGLEHLPESVRSRREDLAGRAKQSPTKPNQDVDVEESATPESLDPERARIEAALRACGGNQTRAAERLGISRRTLSRWLDAHGLPRPKKKSPN